MGEDCVGLDWDLIIAHTSSEGSKVLMDILNNGVRFVTREQETEKFSEEEVLAVKILAE